MLQSSQEIKLWRWGRPLLGHLKPLLQKGLFQPFHGSIETFIYPAIYHFRSVDVLLTNFHLPRTSLMLLVDAFLKDKTAKKGVVDLYQIALQEKFAFYSFGDSLLFCSL